ncbi:MAG: RNA 3'-terminal phosphate cyclase [Candidatus Diapherotrites archaeon]
MIEINGEAGGQVLRTSIGLSSLTGKQVKISSIRTNRPNPGLQAQHLTGLQSVARICGAQVNWARLNSKEVFFSPRETRQTKLAVNVGTAGSTSLVLQPVLFPALQEKIELRVQGGTDVKWAPSHNYLSEVLFPKLKAMGAKFECKLIKPGFYPKGNGAISFKSLPAQLPLKPINLIELGELQFIKIFSQCASLPKEVATNQAASAKKQLASLNIDFEEKINSIESTETIGSSIDVLAFFSSGAVLGANALGEKGKPSERVGKEAAQKLLEELAAKAPVDRHLSDQLIPFMALAKGKSEISCTNLTEHALNNIAVCEKILGVSFEVKGELGNKAEISVEGLGFNC